MTTDITTPVVETEEAFGAPMAPLPLTAHLLEPLIERSRSQPDSPVVAHRVGDEFVDLSARVFLARVRDLAKGFIASGVGAGDRVVLMSHSRYEWLLVDYAILAAGAVTVPAYETSSAEQLGWIISDSDAVAIVLETPEMASMFRAVSSETPHCRESFILDEGGLGHLVARGAEVDDETLDRRISAITTDKLATIVYTSGTTGRPKGCSLTHANLRTNVVQNLEGVRSMLEDNESCLVFLPLAHTLTKIISLVGVEYGINLAFATDMAHLPEELAMVGPTMFVAVPRVFEKVFNSARHKAETDGHGAIFDKAADVAIHWSQNHSGGHRGPIVEVEHLAFDRLVYKKVQDVFGGRMRFAFSGGGPLGERLTHFFNGVGVRIFEGYGLTETSPTLTVNRDGAWKPGTVGQPLAGTSIRIAPDGEILAKGPQVFRGYWNNVAATEATFDDGWFCTGDIGELDGDGFLRITGRKKELIVTAAGKNVAPAPLEDRLRAHPLISQAVVVGDGKPFVAAMVSLDPDAMREWLAEHGVGEKTIAEVVEHPDLLAVIQSAVDEANASVSRAESIRKFAILPEDLTIERGELTPTLKVRRAVVAERYADIIEHLYG